MIALIGSCVCWRQVHSIWKDFLTGKSFTFVSCKQLKLRSWTNPDKQLDCWYRQGVPPIGVQIQATVKLVN